MRDISKCEGLKIGENVSDFYKRLLSDISLTCILNKPLSLLEPDNHHVHVLDHHSTIRFRVLGDV